jgi:chromosome segregation ATPase
MTTDGDLPLQPEPDDTESRIRRLERDVRRLHQDAATTRAMAAMADRDVSEWRMILAQHTKVLNAVGQTQAEHTRLLTGLSQVLQVHGVRLDRVDQRLDGVDQRLDGVDQRLDRVDQRFDGMDQRFDGVDQRFDRVDGELGSMRGTLEELVAAVNRLADPS